MNRVVVGSFKLKLVLYFGLLSLLPMAAAFWGFTSVSSQSETHRVDARLQAGLRAALAAYQERLDTAQAEATTLARKRSFQVALERRDRSALATILAGAPDVYATGPKGFEVGARAPFAAERQVSVVTTSGYVGSAVATVPLDLRLVERLRANAGLAAADSLALLRGSRVVAASPRVTGAVPLSVGKTATVAVAGVRYRTLVAPSLSGVPQARLAVLSPQSLIDSADAAQRNRILLGLLASLALVSIVAYLEGRSIVRTLRTLARAAHAIARGRLGERVPVRGRDEFALLGGAFNDMAGQLEARLAELEAERRRLRDLVARFGEALAATHDVEQLLRVIVETAVEATGARGGRLVASGGAAVETGAPDAEGEPLDVPLVLGARTLGTLLLAGGPFDEEQRVTAGSLASQAAIALENARLHAIVERQALVDGLTGVANRRQCGEALGAEIARAERLGAPLALVLADLDDFKTINDRHGHAAGDEVLRAFAEVLRATVRESDLAGRWGGEEFLLLLPGTDAAGGARLAERVRRAVAGRPLVLADGEPLAVTASFGVAVYRAGAGPEELFAAADRALYRAKGSGKDRVEVEDPVRSP